MSTEVATRNPNALASRPDFIKAGDTRGTENIGKDIRPPALKLAQSMTPQAKRSAVEYIDGLAEGLLFNTITHEIYGEEPVRFIIVNQLGSRNVQFDPANPKVVLDGNVPDGDPRTKFTERLENGAKVRVKPLAKRFTDYLVLLLHDGDRRPELMTFTLSGTQLRKATDLNSILKLSNLPSFAFVIKGTPKPEKKKDFDYYGWAFEPAGWPTEEQYLLAEKYYEEMKDKNVEVERDTIEPEAGDLEGSVVKDTDIPF